MRIWNGLNINDFVLYKNNTYIIKELYERNNKKLCKLISRNEDEIIIFDVPIIECKKIK